MNKQDIIQQLDSGKKVRHRSFLSEEFIHLEEGIITDEKGGKHDAYWSLITDSEFESGWEVVPEDVIQIEIKERRKAMEIHSPNAGKYYLVEEIEVGAGPHKKTLKYTEGFMKQGSRCKAIVIDTGKVRIIL